MYTVCHRLISGALLICLGCAPSLPPSASLGHQQLLRMKGIPDIPGPLAMTQQGNPCVPVTVGDTARPLEALHGDARCLIPGVNPARVH